MARISQDDSSWKAGGIKRRDFRSVKNGPEVAKSGKKKNTKKWCKGVVGRKHDITTIPAPRWAFLDRIGMATFVVDQCTVCKKEFHWRRNPNL